MMLYLVDSQTFLNTDDISTIEVYEKSVVVVKRGAQYFPEIDQDGAVLDYTQPQENFEGADMETILDWAIMEGTLARDAMQKWVISPRAQDLPNPPSESTIATRMTPPDKPLMKKKAAESAAQLEVVKK